MTVFLFGCERKTTTTSTDTASSGTTGTDTEATSTATTSNDSGSSTGGSTSQTGTSGDTESLKAKYLQNLADATTKVQRALGNTATFCTALIEMPNGYTLAQSPQSFFFTTTNTGLKDWYWVVTIDPVENKERHTLAAKSGYKDELECTTLKSNEIAISFDEAYDRAGETGALSTSGDVFKTKITLKNRAWKIIQYDNDGKYSSKEVDATNAYVSTDSTKASATVTTTSTSSIIE